MEELLSTSPKVIPFLYREDDVDDAEWERMKIEHRRFWYPIVHNLKEEDMEDFRDPRNELYHRNPR